MIIKYIDIEKMIAQKKRILEQIANGTIGKNKEENKKIQKSKKSEEKTELKETTEKKEEVVVKTKKTKKTIIAEPQNGEYVAVEVVSAE